MPVRCTYRSPEVLDLWSPPGARAWRASKAASALVDGMVQEGRAKSPLPVGFQRARRLRGHGVARGSSRAPLAGD